MHSAGEPRPTVARFALDGPGLPLVTDAVPLAEAARAALMSLFQRIVHRRTFGTAEKPYQQAFVSRTFAGKDAAGQPLLSHDHAHYLPTAANDAGRIDRLTVWAAEGFGADEVAALDALRWLRFGVAEPLRLVRVGLGRPEDFRCPQFGPARVWTSVTPFVVTRHVKTRGRKKDPPECRGPLGRPAFALRVLAEELERLGRRRPCLAGAAGAAYTLVAGQRLGRGMTFDPLEFRRSRGKSGDDGPRRAAAAIRLEFPEAVSGPICLGHASHFGLGLFEAEG